MKRLIIFLVLNLFLTACAQEAPPAETPSPAPTAALTPAATPSPTPEAAKLQEADLRELIGQKTLTMVNLWGTFCGPCEGEMPDLSELAEEYAKAGLQVVGVVIDVMDSSGNVDPAMQQLAEEIIANATATNFPHLIPKDKLSAELVGISGGAVPTTFFFDQEGSQVGDIVLGAKSKAVWAREIEDRLDMIAGAYETPEGGREDDAPEEGVT
ncbi:MAG: TlpA family protein disulfide reductase [Clostridiales bacterium]|nr:TlpA family protein disulfide reductase [Clostridiales bacterium]